MTDPSEMPSMKPFLLHAIAWSAALAQDARPVRVISEMPGWFVRDRQAVRSDRLAAKECAKRLRRACIRRSDTRLVFSARAEIARDARRARRRESE
jgi:hypothetical protein